MFNINDLSSMQAIPLSGTLAKHPYLYIMDDFYSDPDQVVKLIESHEPARWKKGEKPTKNGVYFDDFRHQFVDKRIEPVYQSLAAHFKISAVNQIAVLTNMTRFFRHSFNDFENHYWWPHEDTGRSMTAIVYLNRQVTGGTNLYLPRRPDPSSGLQTFEPWRKKDRWHLLKTIEARYNRLLLFPSGSLYHGACINDETFFDNEFRLNQVMFFD